MILKVYVDVLFIVNFIVDYVLLCVTSFFIKKKMHIARLLLSSFFGAVYASIIFFATFRAFFIFLLSFIVSVLMIIIAYGADSYKLLFKNTSVFYLVSFVSGGIGFALMSIGNKYSSINFIINSGVFYVNLNAYTLLAIFIFSVTTIHFSLGYIKKQKIKSMYLYDVTIEKNGRSVTDVAFFDTGNFLKDPTSQDSVIIAEWQTISSLFDYSSISECVIKNPGEFIYIPCNSLNGTSGLFAFRPDKVITGELTLTSSIYVGICITSLDKEGAYRMILPNDFSAFVS